MAEKPTDSVERLLGELEEEIENEPTPPPVVRSSLPPPLPQKRSVPPPLPSTRPVTGAYKSAPPPPPRTMPPPPPGSLRNTPLRTPGLGKPASVPPARSGFPTAPGIPVPSVLMEPDSGDTHPTMIAVREADAKDLVEAAKELAAQWENELAQSIDRARKGRLAYELGRLYEGPVRDPQKAHARYQTALSFFPDHVPSLRGARRAAIALKDHRSALALYDAEARITADSRKKAALLYAKARLLEDALGDKVKARDVFATAAELDRKDASILKALEQRDLEAQEIDKLERTYEREANATTDPVQRAAIIVERARLLEHRHKNVDGAIELYETALRLDPKAAGALEALERLCATQGRHRELIRALSRRAEQSGDPVERSLALYRVGRLHAERLGNREEAMAALERAMAERPDDPLVLEELAGLYERAERFDRLVIVLSRLAASTNDPAEQLAAWHRIGQLLDERLNRMEDARAAYERALALDPTHVPTLQALSRIYEALAAWDALVAMHLAEAEEVADLKRRAAAHARVADVLERHGVFPSDKERHDEAIAHHARALSLAPGYAPSFKALARLYAEAGKHRELIELHERAVSDADEPSTAIAHLFKIGSTYEDALAEHEQAAHTYRRILDLDPKHLGALHALQRTTERAGRHAELVDALEREAALRSESARVVDLYARAAEVLDTRIGDRDAAIERYRRVLAIDPSYAPALSGLGRIYHRAGRWEDLLELYRRELEIAPKGAGRAALLHKMGVLSEERIGDETAAVELYKKAIDEDPTHRPSLTALARRLAARRESAELVKILELELEGLTDPAARARAAFRLGEVYEQHLAQPDRAAAAFEAAIASAPGYRPALEGLARLRAAQGAWRRLVDQLEVEANDASEPATAVDRLARAAELWHRALNDPRRAAGVYERVLEINPKHVDALLSLERLYRKLARNDALARVYGQLARVLQDPGARIAVLRELARLEERGERKTEELIAIYEAILGLSPDDPGALDALEALALERADRSLLADVDRRLAAKAGDPKIASAHQTRLAESLEMAGDAGALDAYRAALDGDPENMAAAKGLARVAERRGLPQAVFEAARREAAVTHEPRAAARLLTRAARVAQKELNDPRAALKDFERALELWPDDADAAAGLTELLIESGQVARATDRLSRAAGSAKSPERIAGLWMEVARLQADVLDNVPSALASLARVLKSSPTHVPTLRRTAELHARQGRWAEAAQTFAQVVSLASDRDTLKAAHLELARAWGEHLGDPQRALVSLQAVLALEPDHPDALRRLADVSAMSGDLAKAETTLRRLAELAPTPEQRTAALVRLSEVCGQGEDDEGARRAALHALAMEGPGGAAAERHRSLIEGPEDWQAHAEALRAWLKTEPIDAASVRAAHFEIARVYREELQRPAQAIEVLERGARRDPNDLEIRRALAVTLRLAGRFAEALAELRSLISEHAARSELWRELSITLRAAGEIEESKRALAPLVLIGTAHGEEVREVTAMKTRPARARPGSLDPTLLSALYPMQRAAALAELLRQLLPGLGKVYPPDFDAYGVGSRDRMAKGATQPIRKIADRVAAIFGVPDFHLYLHRARGHRIAVELAEPPAIMIPAPIAEMSEAHQAYAIARAMANVAMGVHVVDKLTPRELEIVLAANARRVSPGFGAGLTNEEILDDIGKRLYKAIPRGKRKPVDDLSRGYAAAADFDFAHVTETIIGAATRAALLVADDLIAAIEVMKRTERDVAELTGARLIVHPPVNRLVRFWISPEADALRKRIGMTSPDPTQGR